MALIREVFECLEDPSRSPITYGVDNFNDMFTRPKVVDGDYIDFIPGQYDQSLMNLVVKVGKFEFVWHRGDQSCRLRDDDDIVGVLSFAHSVRFRELGYCVEENASREDCRKLVLKAVSDLLKKNGQIDRIFRRLAYQDWGFQRIDFEMIRDSLARFGHYGYVCEEGRWRGAEMVKDATRIVGASACALGLVESLNDEQIRRFTYVDITVDEYANLIKVAKDNDSAQRKLSSCKRKARTSSNVSMLLSADDIASICGLLAGSDDEAKSVVLDKLDEMFDAAIRKWHRVCEREIRDIEFRRLEDAILRQ